MVSGIDIQNAGESKSAFRTDIQALRGIAVLLVLFYHAELVGVPAGYLGVDIFFVVSGFLITGLIKNQIEQGSFSFMSFYYRRAKRLLPPAYFVILVTIITAQFFLTEPAIAELKSQVIGAITFTANFVLWGQSGYFDGASETKALLHFWSLAIEEQYYMVMPAFLVFMPRRLWPAAMLALTIISLALCIAFVSYYPTATFYLLPTRGWELGLGALGAIVAPALLGNRILSIGRIPALLVLVAVPFSPISVLHPGIDAILVCGATLVIILGHNGSRWESTLLSRALAWVGNFSYSLYLVHWPILVFTRSAWLGDPPASGMLVAVVLSVGLSWLLYHLVEEPFRRGFYTAPKRTAGGILSASIILAAAPTVVSAATATDVDFNHIRRQNLGIHRACGFGEKYPFNGEIPDICRTKEDPKILVWGDSYARAWTTAIMDPLAEVGIEQATMARCDPLLGTSRLPLKPKDPSKWGRHYSESCAAFSHELMRYIEKADHLEIVVLAARFQTVFSRSNILLVDDGNGRITEYAPSVELVAERLKKSVEAVRRAGKRVVILAPPPANGTNIGACWERKARAKITFVEVPSCDLPYDSVKETRAITFEMLDLVAAQADVSVIEIYDFFCDQLVCKTEIDGIPLYRDSGHLSVDGAKLVGRRTDLAQQIIISAR